MVSLNFGVAIEKADHCSPSRQMSSQVVVEHGALPDCGAQAQDVFKLNMEQLLVSP
jgi:hypothetical protein